MTTWFSSRMKDPSGNLHILIELFFLLSQKEQQQLKSLSYHIDQVDAIMPTLKWGIREQFRLVACSKLTLS